MPNAGCATNNLQTKRFSSEFDEDERVKICLRMNKIVGKLNSTEWSPALSAELKDIWKVFSAQPIALRSMPKENSSRHLAIAEASPSGASDEHFGASVYVRSDKMDTASFFHILFHELRHVYDFYQTWKGKSVVNSVELERRAFLLIGKITQETPEKEKFTEVPKFWKESWRNHSADEISSKREAAIEKYLRKNKLYRNLEQSKQTLDFSRLKSASQTENWKSGKGLKKDVERLPDRLPISITNALLPQNIREINFDLEKPRNSRDEKEILRVALNNEKKLYYGMENFVYDQKLQFQCWRKGKITSEFNESNKVARTADGKTLLESTSVPTKSTLPPCLLNYQPLKTDFTETFWASPALEKMPITFFGFVEVDGKILARYSVLEPNLQLFNQLADEYDLIKPFRIFVGTIYVSPEEGQIVKFSGTSFPEDDITNNNSREVKASYIVTALRQRLNVNNGIWVTVNVNTSGVATIRENFRPFSYTVKLENYRQSKTEVRILEDDVAEMIGAGGK